MGEDRTVTRGDLDGAVVRLEAYIDRAVTRTESTIRDQDTAWRTRTHELADDMQEQKTKLALVEKDVSNIKGSAAIIAGIVGAVVQAAIGLLKRP